MHRQHFRHQQRSGYWRGHDLFRDFLRDKLRWEPGIDENALHRRAAAHYLAQGRLYEALRSSVQGRYFQAVEADMMSIYSFTAASNSVTKHAESLKTYLLDLLPEEQLACSPFCCSTSSGTTLSHG
ncbi:hypothetical protein LJB86_01705 [Deltaproteobacteria bacterium OttesenSCG-928-M10]|nr:hypothetical protein [Deltaproteobacteria bacterium OttesenSCG-928-M10]